jgi:acetyltransferase-like isoleucine patch superfamily enzyme
MFKLISDLTFSFKGNLGNFLLYFTNYIISYVPFHSLRKYFYIKLLGFEVPKSSYIFMGAWFYCPKNFKMGINSIINEKCRLDNRGGLTIGDNVSISAEVCILSADHDLQSPCFEGRINSVLIEDYVFIGTRAMILPGVILGKGCAVAAGAIVTKSAVPFTIVAGVPAKPIGHRVENLEYNCYYPRSFF